MAFSRHDRKAALYRSGKTGRHVAEALGVDDALVSHVLAGRRLTGPDAQRVMIYLAGLFGVPVDEAFPETVVAREGAPNFGRTFSHGLTGAGAPSPEPGRAMKPFSTH